MRMQASAHARQESAHIVQTGLSSAWDRHSSSHIWHTAMHASSIAVIDAGVIPCIRSMARIIVLHMSAQFMHDDAQSICCVAHTAQACSQAAQASMHACIAAMSTCSMPSIDIMSCDMASIIFVSIAEPTLVRGRAGRPPVAMVGARGGRQKARLGS